MALKAGRVGVDPSQVDMAGKIVGGGSGSDSYTKAEADAKFATKTETATLATKASLTANGKEFTFAYDEATQQYGFKLDGTGEFIPFDEGGSAIGWVEPPELIRTGLNPQSGITIISGGYQVLNSVCYVDIIIQKSGTNQQNIYGFPTPSLGSSVLLLSYNRDSDSQDHDDYFSNCVSISSVTLGTDGRVTVPNGSEYRRFIGMYPTT